MFRSRSLRRAKARILLVGLSAVLLHGCQNRDLSSGPSLVNDTPPVAVDPCPPPPDVPVVINEIMLINAGSVLGPEGAQPWIELFNPSTEPYDLAGATITDDLAEAEKWEFPCETETADTVIGAGEYFVLFFSDAQVSDEDLIIDFLPAIDGFVQLALNGANTLEEVQFDAGKLEADETVGLTESGDFVLLLEPTAGLPNSGPLIAPPATFIRGDVDADLDVDGDDLVLLEQILFEQTAPLPACLDRLDVNDDGVLDIADPSFLLLTLEGGGPMIPPPTVTPGLDPTDDDLDCENEVLP